MQRIYLFWFSIIIILSFVNLGTINFAFAQNVPNSDEYSVYEFLLQQEFITRETKSLVIGNQTLVNNVFSVGAPKDLIQEFPSLSKETIDEFNFRNSKAVKLTDKFNLKLKVHLIGKELNQIFTERGQRNSKKDNWQIFREKYSADVYITFSRVGFNKEKTQALIFEAYQCGRFCGGGYYILLVKENSKWKIEKKVGAWYS